MKDLGRTPRGDWLVEMTSEEHRAFVDLTLAMEGKTLRDMHGRGQVEMDQPCPLFFVQRLAGSRALLNELLQRVQELVELMSPKSDEQ